MQAKLFDLSIYDASELVGSHSDDFEDSGTIAKFGKRSKYCPTWDYTPEEQAAASRELRLVTLAIVARFEPATYF